MITFLFMVSLSAMHSVFSMYVNLKLTQNQVTRVSIPIEIMAQIVSFPDIEKIREIIEKQKAINRSQTSYYFNNHVPQEPKRQSFFAIQQALFPCLELISTCKTYRRFYNETTLKEQVANLSKKFLYDVFHQGEILFLLPTAFHVNILKNNFEEGRILANKLLKCCTQQDRIDDNFIRKTLFYAPNTFENDSILASMKYINVPNIINNIVYGTPNNIIVTYTSIEEILYQLFYYISRTEKSLCCQGNLSEIHLRGLFGNFFKVLDFLCSSDNVDLSLPAVSIQGNIAQKIIAEFKKKEYPFDILSEKALANITFHSKDNSNKTSLHEKKDLVDMLVDIFLSNLRDADKKAIRECQKKMPELHCKVTKNRLKATVQIVVLAGIYICWNQLFF
jgi:hypothetical protein